MKPSKGRAMWKSRHIFTLACTLLKRPSGTAVALDDSIASKPPAASADSKAVTLSPADAHSSCQRLVPEEEGGRKDGLSQGGTGSGSCSRGATALTPIDLVDGFAASLQA